jgi:glycosyl hydrolase family 42 (putative beta-galactosidase)
VPRGLSRTLILAVVAGIVAFSASASVGADTGAWTGRVGVAGHLMWYSDQQTEMSRLRAGGVDWTREDFLWDTIEPSKGSFDWSWPDKLMTSSSRTGMNVLAILDYSAKWASSGPNGDGTYAPRDNAEFAAYAAAIVRRYGSGGSFWSAHPELTPRPLGAVEVWNEPWGHWDWKPNPDPAAYARLARATAEAVKAATPGVKVLIAGDLLQARTDGKIIPWLANVLTADPGLKSLVDAYSVHPYPYPRELGPFDERPDARWDFRRLELIHQVDPTRPLWITEVGWSTAPGVSDAVSEAQQATFVRGAVQRALGEWGGFVERIFVYSWDRSNGTSGDREGNFGLRRSDGSTKPAWSALSALLATTPPPSPPPPNPTPPPPPAVSVPSFNLMASPSRVVVGRGGRADFALRVEGSAGVVGVRVSGLPRGARATGSGALSSSSPAAMFVQLGRDVRPGTYRLTFQGTLGSTTRTATATLVVTRKAASLSLFRLFGAQSTWKLLTS